MRVTQMTILTRCVIVCSMYMCVKQFVHVVELDHYDFDRGGH